MDVILPKPVLLPNFGYVAQPDAVNVNFKVNWTQSQNGVSAASFSCPVNVPIYGAQEVDTMLRDLRDEVLKAVKAGVFQAAIKSDQVGSLSDTIQRTVEREIRAGVFREVIELRQQVAALTQRLQKLDTLEQRLRAIEEKRQ